MGIVGGGRLMIAKMTRNTETKGGDDDKRRARGWSGEEGEWGGGGEVMREGTGEMQSDGFEMVQRRGVLKLRGGERRSMERVKERGWREGGRAGVGQTVLEDV